VSNFQQPGISSPEDKFTPSESNGALLLFFPTQLQTQVKTAHGESDAVACRIVRLNDGRVWDNALIFPTALVTQLKAAIPDGMVLGTLGQGENTKGNPPWLLSPHTAQDVAVAEQWLAANPRVSQPAPAAAPPAAWGQQAQTPPNAAPVTPGWGTTPPQAAPAPAAGGWGQAAVPPVQAPYGTPSAPAQGAPSQFPEAAWGAVAAVAPPAAPAPAPTATSNVHPGLVEALRKKGVPLPADATQATAEGIWAVVQHNPDVA
jgi:hypothetical protein